MNSSLYIAIDLGAGSGRVFLAGLDAHELLLEEIRRFHYPPRRLDGHLRWDIQTIFAEIKTGLAAAAQRAKTLGRPVHSIAVDSWGVDYGLIDVAGNIVEDPICYRDEWTSDAMPEIFALVPRAEIYASTGIQFMQINTLCQLFAHHREGLPARADKVLMIPDLINFLLTGNAVTEYTNATTMQLIDAGTRDWDESLLARINFPRNLFTEVITAGAEVGNLKPLLADELGLPNVKVIAPATHDTGSAVAGAPLADNWAYISSGTWSLVGVERNDTLINADTLRHNFTNEGGAFGTIRLLKNVMGLWLLESCRKEWMAQGREVDYALLLQQVAAIEASAGLIFPDDPRFLNPPSMLQAIATQMTETGQRAPTEPHVITKVILDSLALRYAAIVALMESLTQQTIHGVHIVGGGSQNNYLNQVTANVTNKPVIAGPVEATVIGNVLVQAVAAGRFATLTEARAHIAANLSLSRCTPQSSEVWEEAARRYAAIEEQFVGE